MPLWNAYSFQHNINNKLRRTAFRAFVGACVTLASSVANLLTLMILRGEPGWICLICCNSDILFGVIVLQWATNGDSPSAHAPYPQQPPSNRPNRESAQARSSSKGLGLFDLGHTLDCPASDIITLPSAHNIVLSQSSAEDSERKEMPMPGGDSALSDDKSEMELKTIVKRTSVTVESTREGSLTDEKAKTLKSMDIENLP